MLGLKKIKVEWFENLVPGEQRPHFGQFLILTVCFRGRYVWAPQDWTHASQGTRLSTTTTHFYPKIPKLPSTSWEFQPSTFRLSHVCFFLLALKIFLFADVIFDQWHSSRIDIAAPSHHLPSTIDVQSFVRRPFEGSAVLRGSLAGSTGGVRGLNKAQQMAVGFVLLFWGPNRKTLSNYSQIGIEKKNTCTALIPQVNHQLARFVEHQLWQIEKNQPCKNAALPAGKAVKWSRYVRDT